MLVCHDFGRLAGWESSLEEGNENEFVDLVSKVTNKNGEFGAAIIAAVNQSATRSPVETEYSISVGNGCSVQLESLLSSFCSVELDKAITGVTVWC